MRRISGNGSSLNFNYCRAAVGPSIDARAVAIRRRVAGNGAALHNKPAFSAAQALQIDRCPVSVGAVSGDYSTVQYSRCRPQHGDAAAIIGHVPFNPAAGQLRISIVIEQAASAFQRLIVFNASAGHIQRTARANFHAARAPALCIVILDFPAAQIENAIISNVHSRRGIAACVTFVILDGAARHVDNSLCRIGCPAHGNRRILIVLQNGSRPNVQDGVPRTAGLYLDDRASLSGVSAIQDGPFAQRQCGISPQPEHLNSR